MGIIKDSVFALIHDSNGSINTINAIIQNLKKHQENNVLTQELLYQKLDYIEEKVGKIAKVIDSHYIELRKSKLWEEYL